MPARVFLSGQNRNRPPGRARARFRTRAIPDPYSHLVSPPRAAGFAFPRPRVVAVWLLGGVPLARVLVRSTTSRAADYNGLHRIGQFAGREAGVELHRKAVALISPIRRWLKPLATSPSPTSTVPLLIGDLPF